jgi:hypothetical protein
MIRLGGRAGQAGIIFKMKFNFTAALDIPPHFLYII